MAWFDLNELPPVDEDVPADDVSHDAVVCDDVSNGANQVRMVADIVPYPGTTPTQPHGSSHIERPPEDGDFAAQVAWVRWLLPRYVASCESACVENSSPEQFSLPANFSYRFSLPGLANPTPGEVSSPSDMTSAFSARAIAGSASGVQQGESSRTTTNVGANRDGSDMNESYRPQSDNDRPIQRRSRVSKSGP